MEGLYTAKLPEWSRELRNLYWRRRMARPGSKPCLRTWQRRIHAERERLLSLGVCPFELHAVCRILVCSPREPQRQKVAEQRYKSMQRLPLVTGARTPFGVPELLHTTRSVTR